MKAAAKFPELERSGVSEKEGAGLPRQLHPLGGWGQGRQPHCGPVGGVVMDNEVNVQWTTALTSWLEMTV